jgi:hypothetical protein
MTNLNAAHTVDVLSARPVEEPTTILYVAGNYYTTRKIWYTDKLDQSPGGPLPAPIDGALPDGGADLGENAPLVTGPGTDGPLKGLGLFFDRSTTGLGRRLWGAPIDAQGNVGTPMELLPPFNANDGSSSWEFAYAPLAQRVWFMSNREGVLYPKLYTTTAGPGAAPPPVAVSLSTAPNNCAVENNLAESDRAPWVTLDGSLMFFHARETAPGCTYGNKTDMFVVPLKQDGQTAGIHALPLPMNEPNTHDMTPAMSWDMCWLFFASTRNLSDKLRLYRARRI